MRQLLFVIIFLFITIQVFPQVLINEFSASNLSGITDEDGEASDWIELYNADSSETNLNGYHLSDDAGFLSKWTFPDISIEPHSYLLVFASGKNRAELPLTYQTIISKGSSWQYLIPTAEMGNAWKNAGFDASAWKQGNSGFGYSDNDDATILANTISVFIRKEFTIANLNDVEEFVLSIDYDDGFVAFINGHEIARSNLGEPGTLVAYNQGTGTFQHEAEMYQGGLPENFMITDPANYLVEGINVLAIQGHNTALTSSDLSLIPMLTLGLSGSDYSWNIPSYIHLSGRNLHANFKISSEGETLILSRPDSSIVDSVSAVPMSANISFGRNPDGDNFWYYFASPTPEAANTSKGYNEISSDTVKFSYQGGYFPGGLEVRLSTGNSLDTIVYTLDGSIPLSNGKLYSSPILISENSVVRARSVNSQKLPGIITTNTYITTQHDLPVVCLSTNPDNLWDFNTGIFVKGPNAESEDPFLGANFWMDWEKPAHMELYDINGVKKIDQGIGIKIYGAWSRARDQKSLALFARREYGKGSFEYQFFEDKPIEIFESIVLRNGGNDWGRTLMRDGLVSSLIRNMEVDRQAYQPAVVYINGEYWGLMNLREKINNNFIASNHPVDSENVNLLEYDGAIIDGTNTSYNELKNFLNLNTLESEQEYLQVEEEIDIDNYIQYQLTEIYINNGDWPGNNIKFWQTKEPQSPWRWIIFDTDFGFSLYNRSGFAFNTLEFALDPAFNEGWPNPPWSTLLFRRMMSNPGFRNDFINQFADRMNTNFTTEKIHLTVDSLKQIFLPEIDNHLSRWGLSFNAWQSDIETVKTFALRRPDYMRNFLEADMSLEGQLDVIVSIQNQNSGIVQVNSVIPESYPFTGVYFKNLSIRLTAIPAPGFKFVRWEGSVNSTSLSIDYDMAASGNFTAVFESAGVADLNIVINEINYNSSPEKDAKDWLELFNAGKTTVNLKNWVVSDAIADVGYKFNSDLLLTPGEYLLVCRDLAAFRLYHPEVKKSVGDFNFGLAGDGDNINLFDPDGILIDYVNYFSDLPWPADANGTGATIELKNALTDNNLGVNWNSSPEGGTPGSRNLLTLSADQVNSFTASEMSLECFPNPFSDYTTIRVEIPSDGRYKLEVYDLQGRLLNILADQDIDSGTFYFDWNGIDSGYEILKAGIYIVRLSGMNIDMNLKVVKIR